MGGRWGGELARRAESPARWVGPVHPVSSPSGWPAAAVGVGVPPWCCAHSARRRPPSRVWGVRCHSCAAGRIAIERLEVEAPSLHRPFVAVLGGGRGGLPGGRCRGGGHGRGIGPAVGPSPCVSPKCRPCALSCQPAALCEAGAAARALRAGGQVCLGLAAAGAVPHSHRGAPARPACRRGAAVGVAADMIPVHSDPPVFRRRAAMSQFPAAKDYPARATTPTPRRGGEATFGSFAKLTATGTRVYCDIDL